MIGRALQLTPVCNLLFRLTEAGGDPGIFCYRMGVDLLSTDNGRFLAPVSVMARWAQRTLAVSKRNQAACSNLYSTFCTGFSIQESCRHLSDRLGLR
jgi:hypothetical protein